MNGSSLTLMISSSSAATLSTASVSRPDVSCCNQLTNPGIAVLPSGARAAAKARARSVISDQAPAATAAGGTTLVPAQTASAPAAR